MDEDKNEVFERPPEVTDDRHWAFIVLMIGGESQSGAARSLGYGRGRDGKINHKSASSMGWKLNKKYKQIIGTLRDKKLEELETNAARILEETASLAFSNIDNYVELVTREVAAITDEDDDGEEIIIQAAYNTTDIIIRDWDSIDIKDKAAIKSVEKNAQGHIKITLHDKVKPLELLGQYAKIFGKDNLGKVTVIMTSDYGGDA